MEKAVTKNQAKLLIKLADFVAECEQLYDIKIVYGISFIKPANYEISKTRKYKNDIGKIENMEYDKISDFYTCKNNRKLTVSHIRHNKTKTGHAAQKIPKQRDCECTRLKYSFSNCKKHK